jgi:hypothetical protein
VTAWLSRYAAWVDAREPVVGLAVFRVLLGLVLGKVLVTIAWLGVDDALFRAPADGGMTALRESWRFAWLGGPTPAAVDAVLAGGIGACALLVLGVVPNLAAVVAAQAFLALVALHPDAGGGHDKLITNGLWLLALSPCGASLSLPAWWRGRVWDPTPRAAWPRALLILQLSLVYTFAGIAKASPEWWPWGRWDAVYRSLLQPQWNELDTTWVAHVYPLTQAATVLTIAFESLFFLVPAWLLARRRWPALGRWDPRWFFLGLGVVMHGTLEMFMDLGPFAVASVAYYATCFSADEYAAAAARLGRLLGRPTPAGSAT